MTYEQLINEFGKYINIELTPVDGHLLISIDDSDVEIIEIKEHQMCVISGELGLPPSGESENLAFAMLDANFAFMESGGATISRNSESGKYYLYDKFSIESMDGSSFISAIEAFCDVLDVWKKIVANYRSENVGNTEQMDGDFQNFIQV